MDNCGMALARPDVDPAAIRTEAYGKRLTRAHHRRMELLQRRWIAWLQQHLGFSELSGILFLT